MHFPANAISSNYNWFNQNMKQTAATNITHKTHCFMFLIKLKWPKYKNIYNRFVVLFSFAAIG